MNTQSPAIPARVENKLVYMDNNATTAVDPEVLEAMMPFLKEFYGNPSSMHTFGGKVAADIEQARESVASLLGADHSEIVFTSCGTESNSAAIFSSLFLCPQRRKVVISKVEHPAVHNVGKELVRRGYKVEEIPVDAKGRIDIERLDEAVNEQTALVSVMWANNETGNIYPVDKIGAIAKRVGALFHTDAVQAAGKINIALQNMPVDMLSISGHKLHAPKGVGALYIRKGTRFRPLLSGGHQERNRRAGTENVAGIVAMGKAAEIAARNMREENTRVRAMRDTLENSIVSNIPVTRINGDPDNRLPNTSNISFEFIEGEAILLLLDRLGICASSGSACTTGSLEPSHVLRAMGVPYTAAHGAIRFSLSRLNTEDEVDYVIKHLPPVISRLREISPYWKEPGN
ncbi:MAG: cysteine desulfurase NifS [Victivallales bacterium]|nr:cysteine desulfurase NifS [Victivallales bacterium]